MISQILFAAILFMVSTSTLFAVSSEHIAGAYSEAEVTDQDVIDAANFAVAVINKGSLVQILKAQKQVVAGINYSLLLEILQKDGTHHSYKAVVFVPLPVSSLPMRLINSQDMGIL